MLCLFPLHDVPRQPALRSDAWAQQLLREGKAFFNQGRYRDAIAALEAALTFRRKWYFNDELRVASCLNELGISYTRMHRLEEAVRCLQEAVATKRRLLPPTAVSLAVSLCNLACAYHGTTPCPSALPTPSLTLCTC
jgi:tetratricopeptide (TPR) repeat protein